VSKKIGQYFDTKPRCALLPPLLLKHDQLLQIAPCWLEAQQLMDQGSYNRGRSGCFRNREIQHGFVIRNGVVLTVDRIWRPRTSRYICGCPIHLLQSFRYPVIQINCQDGFAASSFPMDPDGLTIEARGQCCISVYPEPISNCWKLVDPLASVIKAIRLPRFECIIINLLRRKPFLKFFEIAT
jgi:hypothetical protein